MSAPHSLQLEAAVLGTVLMADTTLPALVSVEGLSPASFYRPSHAEAFRAMVDMSTAGERVDVTLLQAELARRNPDLPDDLAASLFAAAEPGFAPDYARRLKALERLRVKHRAAAELVEAAERQDFDAVSEAEAALSGSSDTRSRRRSREERQEAVQEMAEGHATVWTTPFGAKLNGLLAGGLRPGQFTVLGGWASHGKSVVAQQTLAHVSSQGGRCALYTNEMAAAEIDARDVARVSGVPFMKLVTGGVEGPDWPPLTKAINGLGKAYELIEAEGMTADEIAYDLRRERWDVAVVDLLNGLPNSTETKDIDRNVSTLASASRQSGSHVIACQHLNQARHVGKLYPPEPVAADIRGSGGIYNLANNVLFIYLEEGVKQGQSSDRAVMPVAKARGGVKGRVELAFEPHKMRFLATAPPGTVGVLAA